MNTGSSIVTLDTRTIPGGSLAEYLFRKPIDGFIRCDCCNLPVMEVRDGVLIVKARHYGQKHVSVIPLYKLGLGIV